MIHDSLSVHFDGTGVCQCILMLLDPIRACWWHLSPCQCMMMMTLDSLIMHVDDTWPSVHLTVTDFINITQRPSCHLYLALSLAAVTNVPLALETDDRQVSVQFLLLRLNTQIDRVWNVTAHEQKPDFVFRRNGRVHLNWQGSQFSRLLAAGCAHQR